jgi:CO dehydrogenase/acetyl-CoA synthase beta subunit
MNTIKIAKILAFIAAMSTAAATAAGGDIATGVGIALAALSSPSALQKNGG